MVRYFLAKSAYWRARAAKSTSFLYISLEAAIMQHVWHELHIAWAQRAHCPAALGRRWRAGKRKKLWKLASGTASQAHHPQQHCMCEKELRQAYACRFPCICYVNVLVDIEPDTLPPTTWPFRESQRIERPNLYTRLRRATTTQAASANRAY